MHNVRTSLEVYLPFGNLLRKGTYVAVVLKFVALDIVFQIENWYLYCTTFFNKKQKKGQNIGKPIFHTSAARCLKANIG